MIWNNEYLVLSYPRNGTHSIYQAFVESFPGPVYGLVSQGQFNTLNKNDFLNYIETGGGHENLSKAKKILLRYGRSLCQFKKILVPTRNLIESSVSQYCFMRSNFERNRYRESFQLAINSNFSDFIRSFRPASYAGWFEQDGIRLENVESFNINYAFSEFERIFNLKLSSQAFPHFNENKLKEKFQISDGDIELIHNSGSFLREVDRRLFEVP